MAPIQKASPVQRIPLSGPESGVADDAAKFLFYGAIDHAGSWETVRPGGKVLGLVSPGCIDSERSRGSGVLAFSAAFFFSGRLIRI